MSGRTTFGANIKNSLQINSPDLIELLQLILQNIFLCSAKNGESGYKTNQKINIFTIAVKVLIFYGVSACIICLMYA